MNCSSVEITTNTTSNNIDVINNSLRTIEIRVSTGTRGFSAYELAVQNGYTGTLAQWLAEQYQTTFETVSKNLNALDAEYFYTGENLTSVNYNNGQVLKTLAYDGNDNLTSVTLAGTFTFSKIKKNFVYDSAGNLMEHFYSTA
jgi:YD repeat-containing protein